MPSHAIPGTLHQNYENYEILNISLQNNENHEIQRIQIQNY